MKFAVARIFAAVFWFAWAGVIVPGHTRGIISLADQGGKACCHSSNGRMPTEKAPLPTSKNCAVCAAAAKVGHETIAIPAALKLGFVELAFLPDLTEAPALERILSFQTRGPPNSSSQIDVVG